MKTSSGPRQLPALSQGQCRARIFSLTDRCRKDASDQGVEYPRENDSPAAFCLTTPTTAHATYVTD